MKSLSILDFDGVFCDSAFENAVTAWRVCHRLWPAEFDSAAVPEEVARRFGVARPFLETGWQSVVMVWAIARKMPAAAYSTGLESSLPSLLEQMHSSRGELVDRFREERNRYLAEDAAGWLALHRFYPGAADALRILQQRGEVRILTTKETRFVRELFAHECVEVADECILGLDRIANKRQSLREFAGSGKYDRIAFVEDRYETLRKCAATAELQSIRLFLAAWGYNTPGQRAMAASADGARMTVLDNPAALCGIVD